jgi:hypothetical protein
MGDAGYADHMANHFYKLPGGAEPAPDQKTKFFNSWDRFGVRPAGDKLKTPDGNPVDKEDVLTLTDTAIEVRVPVEITILGAGKVDTARGRVVVVCTDAALLAELKQLKDSANPDQGSTTPPNELMRKTVNWRVLRIESDLAPVSITPPPGRGSPGEGPGGPPGG